MADDKHEGTAFGIDLRMNEKGLKIFAAIVTAAVMGGGGLTLNSVLSGLREEKQVVASGADQAILHIRLLEKEIRALQLELLDCSLSGD